MMFKTLAVLHWKVRAEQWSHALFNKAVKRIVSWNIQWDQSIQKQRIEKQED
jgi:hypothetical protein